MAQGDLATLTNVKGWLSVDTADTTQDAVLSRLITAISGQVRTIISRDSLQSQVWTELRSPRPSGTVMLKHWPVTSIVSVLSDGVLVPQAVYSPGPGAPELVSDGWVLSPYDGPPGGHQTISWVSGWCGWAGSRSGIQLVYRAGYLVEGEGLVVSSPSFQYQVLAPLGSWSGDVSVVDPQTGGQLTQVWTTPTAPGTYQVLPAPPGGQPGLYQFSGADVGRALVVSYSFVPADLEQIVIDIISERNAYRSRIGQRSKSLGGQETMSWDTSGMPAWASAALLPYTDVVPVYT